MKNLSIMLSKAAPSEELGILLMEYFLQVHREDFDLHCKDSLVPEFFVAVITYLFVSIHFIV